MKVAKSKNGDYVDIHNSKGNVEYYCIACNQPVNRRIGKKLQYFAHPKDVDHNCDKKVSNMMKAYLDRVKYEENTKSNTPTKLLQPIVEEKEEKPNILSLKNINGYNEQQWESIINTEGRIGVSSGAGSGKSHSLIGKICYLINEKSVNPNRILCISFTNKVVDEMKKRLHSIVGFEGDSVKVSTMHGLCFGLLKDFGIIDGWNIMKTWEAKRFFDKEYKLKNTTYLKDWKPSQVLNFISYQKSICRNHENLLIKDGKEFMEEELIDVCREYNNFKIRNKLLDFSDMLYILWRVLKANPNMLGQVQELYDYVLYDEYNDSNVIQDEIINMISAKKNNVTYYFDSKQSIYGFNGSEVNLTLDFLKNFPEGRVINLMYNYRSNSNIVEISNAVIHEFESRYNHLISSQPVKLDNGKITLSSFQNCEYEAKHIANVIESKINSGNNEYSDFYILARTNARLNFIEEALIKNKIPYYRKNAISFLERAEIKDLYSYLKIVSDSNSDALERVINIPNRYLGKQAINIIKECADSEDISLYDSLIEARRLGEKNYWVRGANELYTKISKYKRYRYNKLSELIKYIVEDLDYKSYLEKNDMTNKLEDKLENIKSFANMADKYNTLEEFLEYVEKDNDVEKNEHDTNKVEIMSIHSSKGLESKIVFVVGFEDGVLPHFKCKDVEEERRLAYVALSRAEDELHISYSRTFYLDSSKVAEPSEFIESIDHLVDVIHY